MIVDPTAFTILCFGDSNTFGQIAERSGRWPADVRWTGRLQQLLGAGYAVIEEGLGGRTTDLDDSECDGRNGRTYFEPCLRSHSPLDMVVIMLGINDTKIRFCRDSDATATALEGYMDIVERIAWTRSGGVPEVLLVSPIHLDADQPAFAQHSSKYDAESVRKSYELSASIHRVAEKRGALFVDAAAVASTGIDGLHLSRRSHEHLSELIAQTIKANHEPRAESG
ncbi:GDSL-type esterase/lipase family protein [Nocardia sp. CNY236]|uniref:GDSL-type esterase/lipase family protein n=1 Tax=Nocardia sp. CNY236 TaxID=1169152 RepID=UPI0004275D8C|nr:GDSL-type esterase/lipase family protein [Nocardia sp. CNY236]